MILGSGENCVRSVLWHFRWVFRSCWATLARALSVPGRSLVLGCQKLHCRGLRTSVRSAQMCIFAIFPAIFVFFSEAVRTWSLFLQGGRDMAGKIPTTFATSCNRPSALWASQPSLLSSSLLSTFLLRFTSLFYFFSPIFLLFTPFPPPFPSLVPFFPTIFQHFSFISSHFPLFPAFFGQADMSLCNFLANFVPREAPQTSERDML